MSDDESDSEARGVDALRLLKQGNLIAPSDTGARSSASPASVPLVALLPSQKRSRSLSQDLNEHSQSNAIQKVDTPAANKRAIQRQNSQDRNIRQHSSAPERCFSLSKELRNSKSAPDLTLPALAAIRGLQNGTLQVDKHTRMKIAAAAKRVLAARELKRRSSLEAEARPSCPYAGPDPVSPLASNPPTLWDAPNQTVPSPSPPLPESRALSKGRSLDGPGQLGEVPEFVGTAAAIARGQSPAKGMYHRPALGTVSQGGALLSTTHRPFTVTTGLPRFQTGDSPQGDSEYVQPHPYPAVVKSPAANDRPAPSGSKLLDAADILKPRTERS